MIAGIISNTGTARLWKVVAGVLLCAGFIGLGERIGTLISDLHARNTWPTADGEILSATQQDDQDLSRRSGSIAGHTRYWVEYEVGIAIPAQQCRTGIIYQGSAATWPCHGIVKTRSTQSTSQLFQWFLHGYHVHQPVKVLWNPVGTSSTEIKIVGESIWLRYNTDRLVLSLLWVLAFGALYAFSSNRLEYFKTHPEEEILPQEADQGSQSQDRADCFR